MKLFTPLLSPSTAWLLIAFLAAASFALSAQAADGDPAYAKIADERAGKIVASLGLQDADQAAKVKATISKQYQDLKVADEPTDSAKKALKTATADKKEAAKATLAQVEAEHATKIAALHEAYLKALSASLTPDQVDRVKDGMTYGVLPLTFRVYQELLPNLTSEQKAQILAWLTEAREHAIDAGSSEEKHAWFGKYKGRINNYLSKAGIDMKEAEKEMAERTAHKKS